MSDFEQRVNLWGIIASPFSFIYFSSIDNTEPNYNYWWMGGTGSLGPGVRVAKSIVLQLNLWYSCGHGTAFFRHSLIL